MIGSQSCFETSDVYPLMQESHKQGEMSCTQQRVQDIFHTYLLLDHYSCVEVATKRTRWVMGITDTGSLTYFSKETYTCFGWTDVGAYKKLMSSWRARRGQQQFWNVNLFGTDFLGEVTCAVSQPHVHSCFLRMAMQCVQ
eukprot:TRINITY_DN61054_c0_g3_i1.p3 TRINITY_DN61054_c0_g3~~TRINITY_DN61054_c0_g3_i1.p3  ORF type:complete len:140 (+),score=13.95 TRINITY_DN61054_c0_g3_i1:490-909(+)